MIAPPYRLSRSDRYCRLLRPFQHPGDPGDVQERLIKLAKSMFRRPVEKRALDELPMEKEVVTSPFSAAYTYFGQFIMHDLTFDDTPFRSAGLREPEETINYRNPKLDLDSVYGEGPFSETHRHLYAGIRFRLGPIRNPNGAYFDVPLADGCFPAVADERNCENAILRQIHALFLLLHNRAVDNLKDQFHKTESELFEAARDRVRWQFQWLVRYDFLPRICNLRVYKAVTSGCQRLIHWPPGKFSIPIEFSHAAGRFGHSMVRKSYILRKGGSEIFLPDLFGSTSRVGPLPVVQAVEWSHFAQERTREIDTTLVNPFERLPDATIDPYVMSPMPHAPHSLAFRTLVRGAMTRLPTGQHFRVALREANLNFSSPDVQRDELLRDLGFDHETPLWYYLLLEAESWGKRRLGPIGSRIVAEVIEAALIHDRDSFLFQENEKWRRDLCKHQDEPTVVEHLSNLAITVGLEKQRQ